MRLHSNSALRWFCFLAWLALLLAQQVAASHVIGHVSGSDKTEATVADRSQSDPAAGSELTCAKCTLFLSIDGGLVSTGAHPRPLNLAGLPPLHVATAVCAAPAPVACSRDPPPKFS